MNNLYIKPFNEGFRYIFLVFLLEYEHYSITLFCNVSYFCQIIYGKMAYYKSSK